MTKEEYLDRYEAQFIVRGVPPQYAKECRNAIGDDIEIDDFPEDAADEEMSYWGE